MVKMLLCVMFGVYCTMRQTLFNFLLLFKQTTPQNSLQIKYWVDLFRILLTTVTQCRFSSLSEQSRRFPNNRALLAAEAIEENTLVMLFLLSFFLFSSACISFCLLPLFACLLAKFVSKVSRYVRIM